MDSPSDMRVRLVTDTPDFQHWADLRRAVYLDAGFISQADLHADQRYLDQYDERSQHVLVTRAYDDRPIGCARLIHRRPGGPLQVEDHFHIAGAANGAEISGFVVHPDHRGSMVVLVLVRALIDLALRAGIEWVYAEVEPEFLTALRHMGFPMEPITTQRLIYNTWNVVAHARVPAFISDVQSRHADGTGGWFEEFFTQGTRWHHSASDPRDEGRSE